jgi:serine/threonine-protein kinase
MLGHTKGPQHVQGRGSQVTEFREFQDGELIAGTRYRVIRLVGVGGMGSVYEVEHTELGKRFVLKALLRDLARREDLVQRLRNEWRALARLQHANIVNVTDAGTSGSGVPFYVMERLDGDTLAAHLKQKRRLHVLEAVAIAASVLDALSAAHDIGIIHRDVKPANIFMVSGGGVKLLDFGVAKIADANSVVTARGLAVGTPRYMSPEQARGERVDGRSDIYATGLILFEMIAGIGPFDDARDANELLLAHLAREAPPLSSLVMGVSPELERILVSMLAKDCRARPAHARHIAQHLREFATRSQQTPTTDAPTVQAGYAADTVVPGRSSSSSSPNLGHGTRPEGVLAGGRRADLSVSDAPTERIAAASDTTQVTVSVNTRDTFAVSVSPNTTLVSSPAFDGSTTLQMTALAPASSTRTSPPSFAPEEQLDRTEILGDFAPPAPGDSIVTRTQVPIPDVARPASLTPPPVVDTGRASSAALPRGNRAARLVALFAACCALLVSASAFLQRSSPPAALVTPTVAARPLAPAQASSTSIQRSEPAAVTAATSAAPVVALADAPLQAASPANAAPPSPNLPTFSEGRRLNVAALPKHGFAQAAAPGVFLRAVPVQARVLRPKSPAPEAAMPASGL